VTLRGIASVPKRFIFSKAGYLSEELVIKRDSHATGEVSIKLKRDGAAGGIAPPR